MLCRIGSTRSLSFWANFPKDEQNELTVWLEPVEKLVRAILMARALVYLLMTPEGFALRNRSRMQAPTPAHTPDVPHAAPLAQTTEAPIQRPAEPLVAPTAPLTPDAHDPVNWRCCFPIIGRATDPDAFDPDPPEFARAATRHRHPMRSAARDRIREMDRSSAAARAFARRIEALARVIADPDTAMLRLAREIAALPREALAEGDDPAFQLRRWRHGADAYVAAARHADCLLWLFHYAQRGQVLLTEESDHIREDPD